MALTKTVSEDRIEVATEFKHIHIRTKTLIREDNVEISSSFHRHALACCTKATGSWADTDISGESTEVQAIANAVWTSTIKTAYQQMMDAQEI